MTKMRTPLSALALRALKAAHGKPMDEAFRILAAARKYHESRFPSCRRQPR